MIASQRVERIPGSPAVTLQWITFLFAAFLSLLNWPLVSNRAFQLSELSETVICRSGQWKGRVEEPLKSDSTSKYAASFCNRPCRYNSREWVTTSWQFIVLIFCFMGYWFLWTLERRTLRSTLCPSIKILTIWDSCFHCTLEYNQFQLKFISLILFPINYYKKKSASLLSLERCMK